MTTSPPPPAERTRVDPPWPPDAPRHDAGDPDDAFPVPFGMLDGFALILWSLVGIVIVSAVAATMGVDFDDEVVVLSLTLAIQAIVIAGALAWLRMRNALSWRLLGPVRPRWRHVGIGLGIGAVGLVLFLAVATMVNDVFGPFPDPDQSLLATTEAGPVAIALLVLGSVVGAPLSEELIFRSVMFQSTRRRFGVIAGLVVSSLLWAYVHTSAIGAPQALIGLVALGIWLAGSFHRTGTIVVAVVGHATYNALVVALQVLASPTSTG